MSDFHNIESGTESGIVTTVEARWSITEMNVAGVVAGW